MGHSLKKRDICRKALEFRRAGTLYNIENSELDDNFQGSIDRFCEIASRLQNSKRVLDVGAGGGLLLSLLTELGHECYAVDVTELVEKSPEIFEGKNISFERCNVEVDSLPFPDASFDAVVCCQVLEHFVHSPLNAMREMRRVLKPGGIVEIDVPNAVSFRSRSRMLRGKHITWDYKKHYLYAEPVVYKALSFFPDRHNREFTRDELRLTLEETGFENIEVRFLKSRRHRDGLAKLKSIGSALRDLVPSLRKSLIAFGEKPEDEG